ncbi:MAG: ABC transporter permease [Chloroflexi bacterium]|nr:ABC transporter permease [Chloroflexota bacterium]
MQRNPFFAPLERPAPLLPTYAVYLQNAAGLDFGSLPLGAGMPVGEAVLKAAGASVSLLAVAFAFSVVAGVLLGVIAARANPPRVSLWLAPLSTVGLAMPSFYLGTLFVVGAVAMAGRFGADTLNIPVAGYGLDAHLILPVIALMLRPTVQIAQMAAHLLADELGKRYVVTAWAVGNSWGRIRWRHAFRNVLAPIILTMAGSFRLLMGEMIVVERLFSWPGIGRLLALILIPSQGSHVEESLYFLHPSALAATLTAFAFFFLIADLTASGLVRALAPHLRRAEESQ